MTTSKTYRKRPNPALMRLKLAVLSVTLSLTVPAGTSVEAQSEVETQTYRIAVQATAGATRTLETWRATEAALNRAGALEDLPYRFSIVPETGASLRNAIDAGSIDLLLTDPAAFVVAEVDYGARALLATARIINGQSVSQTGALIFTRSDAPYTTLADLEGRDVMAVARMDFSGWWLAAQEFRRFRLEPEEHLNEITFSGGNEREVIYAVQSGLVDAGVVRAGALEELAAQGAIELDDFRMISGRAFDGFPYRVSTPLYPERVLSALPDVPDSVLSLVINTLLTLEETDPAAQQLGGLAWQAPENYQDVHELLVSLRAPPYENYLWQAALRIHAVYRWPIYSVVLAILASLAFLAYQTKRNIALAEARRNVLNSESRSKVFYRNAIEEHTIFCMLTRDGKISHVNERFCELANQDRHSLLGKELSTFLSERDQSVLMGDIQQSMDLKTPWNGHLRLQQLGGSYAWAQCTVIPVTGAEDELSEVALVATDMTSTQQDVVEETFNDTLELIEDPVIVLHPKSLNMAYCNKAARKLLLEDRMGGDWKDRPLNEIITEDDLNALKMRREAVMKGHQRRLTWEVDTRRNVSYEISLEYVVPEMDAPSLVVMYRDISERKEAERAKAEFVSTVSHELRTPLTSMKGALKLASSGMVGEVPDKMKDLLSMANRNTDRLVTLINDILDLEKIEAQKMIYELEEIDLLELVEQSVEANSFYAQRFNVSLAIRPDEENGPYITKGDRDRLLQVMDNLLSNAAKFSHEGDEVTIKLFPHNGAIRMAIRDYGTGIPDGSQRKIFDKFVQSDSSDTRSKGGTGLGLSIVRPIIAAHNGAISFHSEVGIGTEFFVDLPRVDGEEVSKVEVLDDVVADNFSPRDQKEEAAAIANESVLLQHFLKELQRSGWGTELDPGSVTASQILDGSGGVLDKALAMESLGKDRRKILSDLMDLEVIENAPVHILEAEFEGELGENDSAESLGTRAVSDWLGSLPGLISRPVDTPEPLEVMLIAGNDSILNAGEMVETTETKGAADAVEKLSSEIFDVILHMSETSETIAALMVPTSNGRLSTDLPITIFAGRKAKKDTGMGVVSKFNVPNSGRARKTS